MTPETMNHVPHATEASWTRVRGELRRSLGNDAFKNWIDPLVFRGAGEGVVAFEVPTSFIGTWVERNYGDTIRHLFERDGVSVGRLEFGVGTRPPAFARAPEQMAANEAARPSRPAASAAQVEGELPQAPLDSRFTFDNFVEIGRAHV